MVKLAVPVVGSKTGLKSLDCLISRWPQYQVICGIGLPVSVHINLVGSPSDALIGLSGRTNLGASPPSSLAVCEEIGDQNYNKRQAHAVNSQLILGSELFEECHKFIIKITSLLNLTNGFVLTFFKITDFGMLETKIVDRLPKNAIRLFLNVTVGFLRIFNGSSANARTAPALSHEKRSRDAPPMRRIL